MLSKHEQGLHKFARYKDQNRDAQIVMKNDYKRQLKEKRGVPMDLSLEYFNNFIGRPTRELQSFYELSNNVEQNAMRKGVPHRTKKAAALHVFSNNYLTAAISPYLGGYLDPPKDVANADQTEPFGRNMMGALITDRDQSAFRHHYGSHALNQINYMNEMLYRTHSIEQMNEFSTIIKNKAKEKGVSSDVSNAIDDEYYKGKRKFSERAMDRIHDSYMKTYKENEAQQNNHADNEQNYLRDIDIIVDDAITDYIEFRKNLLAKLG